MSKSDAARSRPQHIDAVASVSEHPQWYFRSGEFTSTEMISLLVLEATQHGAEELSVRHVDGWWVVASSLDWLQGSEDPFFALTPDAVAGVNAARVEILLTAFCPRVITATSAGISTIAGGGAPASRDATSLNAACEGWSRVVAFVPPHPRGASIRDEGRPRLVLVTPENLTELLGDAVSHLPDKVSELHMRGRR